MDTITISPEWSADPVPDSPPYPLVFMTVTGHEHVQFWRRMYPDEAAADEPLSAIGYQQMQEGMPSFELRRFDGPDSMLANRPDGTLVMVLAPVNVVLKGPNEPAPALTKPRLWNSYNPDDPGIDQFEFRTANICAQLVRYRGEVCDSDLLDALEAITDVNDDLHHDREWTGVDASVARAQTALQRLSTRLRSPPAEV